MGFCELARALLLTRDCRRTLASSSKGLEQTGSQYQAKSQEGMVGGGGIQVVYFIM